MAVLVSIARHDSPVLRTGHRAGFAIVRNLDDALTKPSNTELEPDDRGPLGRTQKERVRVFRAGSTPVEVEVFRVLNVQERPELRDAALRGTLHRLEDGTSVDVPFVYHDPAAEKLALVIPNGARGREPSERAKLAEQLAAGQPAAVPEYARAFSLVRGSEGLARFLEEPPEMEVAADELVPVDGSPVVASRFPRLAALLPPAGFWAHADTELAPLVDEQKLWVFVQLGEAERDSFRESGCDLLLQLKTVEQLPVCILALTDTRADAVRRAYLDPAPEADFRLLDLLRRDFHANVVVFSEERQLLRAFRLEGPRAANVQRIVDRLQHGSRYERSRWDEAARACRRAPLPVGGFEHPFVLRNAAKNAAEAMQDLRELERWAAPDKTAEALEILSVPVAVFEIARRRIVADATRFGLAMSDALVMEAVRFGIAQSAAELVAQMQERFGKTVGSASTQGLDDAEIEANWEGLGHLRELHGTSTEPDLSCTIEHSG